MSVSGVIQELDQDSVEQVGGGMRLDPAGPIRVYDQRFDTGGYRFSAFQEMRYIGWNYF